MGPGRPARAVRAEGPHTVITAPPAALFRNSGILMPAARIDGSPWMLQSEDILRELGYQKVSDEDMLALFRALRGGLHRVDSGPRFWYEWSLDRDQHPRLRPDFAITFCARFRFCTSTSH